MNPSISVIVPALNEAEVLDKSLERIAANNPDEIIIVDGGSSDETVTIASRFGVVTSAEKGRAVQMNAGARIATGDIYLFVHADTLIPVDACEEIRDVLKDEQGGGVFRLAFDDKRSPLLAFYGKCTQLRIASFCFGDRGIFVTKEIFETTGGFPLVPLFEDLEFVRAIRKVAPFHFLRQISTTSARRFQGQGAFRQQLLNTQLWLRYMAGADPAVLASLYPYD